MAQIRFDMTNFFEKEFLEAKERLLDRPDILRRFETKGITRETTSKLPVGLTKEDVVFFPLYSWMTKDIFEPTWVIFFNEFLEAGITLFNKPHKGGFLGVTQPKEREEAIIATDPFEWMLLWQEWYDYTWCVPDHSRRPKSIRFWRRACFLHPISDEDQHHYRDTLIASYNLEEYHGWLVKNIPLSIVHGMEAPRFRNPFVYKGKNYIAAFRGHGLFLIDEDHQQTRGNASGPYYIFQHPELGTIEMVPSYAPKYYGDIFDIDERDVYDQLFFYLKDTLYFMSELQVQIVTTMVMYLWVSYHDDMKWQFQIVSREDMWLHQIFNIVYPLLPHSAVSNGSSYLSACFNVERWERRNNNAWVNILLTHLKSWLFGYGIPLYIDEVMGNGEIRPYRNVTNEWLRALLFNYALHFKYTDEDKKSMRTRNRYTFMKPFDIVLSKFYTLQTWGSRGRQIATEILDSRNNIQRDLKDGKVEWSFNFFQPIVWRKRVRRLSKRSKKLTDKRSKSKGLMPENSLSEDDDGSLSMNPDTQTSWSISQEE